MRNCIKKDVDYLGADLNQCSDKTYSLEDCQLLCGNKEGCAHFTWIGLGHGRYKDCCLKTANGWREGKNVGMYSGPKVCPDKGIISFKCKIT